MILLIDTTKDGQGKTVLDNVEATKKSKTDYEYIDAPGLNISHCLGCNYCWLKTPGECVVKDDYEPILKKISKANQVWLITDTKFGFVSYETKNIVDRVMPLVTMNIHFVKKQMRHVMRYEKNPDWGVIYTGNGDKDYLTKWCERVAINFEGKSLGAHRIDEIEEAVKCM